MTIFLDVKGICLDLISYIIFIKAIIVYFLLAFVLCAEHWVIEISMP